MKHSSALKSRLASGVRISLLSLLLASCAQLHRTQLADIDNRVSDGHAFSLKVSETGVDLHEVAAIAVAASKVSKFQQAGESIGAVAEIVSLFQMGPATGNNVYNEVYAASVLDMVKQACPDGRITDLVSIRESRKYPVISGEIVKFNGTCLKSL